MFKKAQQVFCKVTVIFLHSFIVFFLSPPQIKNILMTTTEFVEIQGLGFVWGRGGVLLLIFLFLVSV